MPAEMPLSTGSGTVTGRPLNFAVEAFDTTRGIINLGKDMTALMKAGEHNLRTEASPERN